MPTSPIHRLVLAFSDLFDLEVSPNFWIETHAVIEDENLENDFLNDSIGKLEHPGTYRRDEISEQEHDPQAVKITLAFLKFLRAIPESVRCFYDVEGDDDAD